MNGRENLTMARMDSLERMRFEFNKQLPMTKRERILMMHIVKLEESMKKPTKKKKDQDEKEVSKD